MRKFDYRAPRFAVDLPVRLTLLESTQFGRCTEISTEGMKLDMRDAALRRCRRCGSRYVSECQPRSPVRVAHCGAGCDGVQFVYGSDEERDEVIRFIALLATAPQQAGPVPSAADSRSH